MLTARSMRHVKRMSVRGAAAATLHDTAVIINAWEQRVTGAPRRKFSVPFIFFYVWCALQQRRIIKCLFWFKLNYRYTGSDFMTVREYVWFWEFLSAFILLVPAGGCLATLYSVDVNFRLHEQWKSSKFSRNNPAQTPKRTLTTSAPRTVRIRYVFNVARPLGLLTSCKTCPPCKDSIQSYWHVLDLLKYLFFGNKIKNAKCKIVIVADVRPENLGYLVQQ